MSQNPSNSNPGSGLVEPMETGPQELTQAVQVEITHSGRQIFDGVLPNSQIRLIWTKVFDRQLSEIEVYNFRQFPGRCLRITFQLKDPVKLAEIHPTPDFNFFYTTLGHPHLLLGRILGYNNIPEPKIGDEVLVTVLMNTDITTQNIIRWLKLFGDTVGNHYYAKDAEGVQTGALHIKLVLKFHIPEFLPMFGQKIRIYYAGMPRQCSSCYRSGHYKRDCNKTKTDWLGFIERLLDTGLYDEELFGNWIEVLDDRNRNHNQQKNGGRRSRSPQPRSGRRYNGFRRQNDGRQNVKRQEKRGRSSPSPQAGPSTSSSNNKHSSNRNNRNDRKADDRNGNRNNDDRRDSDNRQGRGKNQKNNNNDLRSVINAKKEQSQPRSQGHCKNQKANKRDRSNDSEGSPRRHRQRAGSDRGY